MIPPRDRMAVPPPRAVLDYARRLGVRRTLLRAAYVMTNQVLAVSVFDCVTLCPGDVDGAPIESAGRFACRFLEPGEIARLAGDLDAVGERILREAITRNDLCHVVLDGERLANIGFYANRPTPILNDLMVHFDSRHWYMYGAFTPAAYRGHRLHALGILGAARELFGRQVPALVGVYEWTNYRSMVSALRMGWRQCGTLYRVQAGSWLRLGSSPAARAIGMRLESRRVEDRA